MHVHTHFSTCVCVCAHACMCVCVRSHTVPGETRLICQWCRSSFMINSSACWKQCFCALATCGTAVNCMCVSGIVGQPAGLPTLTACSGFVDVVNAVEHESTTCQKRCVFARPCRSFTGWVCFLRSPHMWSPITQPSKSDNGEGIRLLPRTDLTCLLALQKCNNHKQMYSGTGDSCRPWSSD